MEYDWFYLESLATSFVFRASNSSAAGDAGDMVNTDAASRVNGSPFTTSGSCASAAGMWWYSITVGCCHSRLLGSSAGFWWDGVGNLKAARLMIRIVQ